jgi:hypothetical protein
MPPQKKPQPTEHALVRSPIALVSCIRKARPAVKLQKPGPVAEFGDGDEVVIKSPPAVDNAPKMVLEVSSKPTLVVSERTVSQKHTMLLELVQRPEGATIDELMTASGWQKHSVRGFIAGFVKKTLGLSVLSTRTAEGARCYRITTGVGDATA